MADIRALYRNRQKTWTNGKECRKSYGLSSQQIKLCQGHLDLMGTVAIASGKGIDACTRQFYDRRWNCSSLSQAPKLTKDLKRGTREQAFAYAMASAALTHSIARACSVGITTKCSCGKLPSEAPTGDYKWGGCGDDVEFGLRFSELFTDYHVDKTSKKKKTMMNSHNTAAGNKVVYDSLTTACKCHGVSGSCSIKTCWRSLADFDDIAETLKDKFGMAIEVKRKRKGEFHKFVPRYKKMDSIPMDELVYVSKSPDYCSPDRKLGSIGTKDRSCDPDSTGPGGCDIMCCGRGYESSDVTLVERCECKYYWCCYVKCKTCSKTLRVHRCR
ncbi:W11B2-like protein [Mya arenaria]|uniref:Protein Wnt n=1 Tax=Mya arenaria TaxID=6604 RepID=A0ABY7G5T2_MYAAR|nr:W11B2-like protein [Mya arenaria]